MLKVFSFLFLAVRERSTFQKYFVEVKEKIFMKFSLFFVVLRFSFSKKIKSHDEKKKTKKVKVNT